MLGIIKTNESGICIIRNRIYVEILKDIIFKHKIQKISKLNNSDIKPDIIGINKSSDLQFDVFLCHNNEDKAFVKKIGSALKKKGLNPWLDEWELRPGMLWQKALEEQIMNIKSVAIFVSKNGIGPWQDLEQQSFINEFVKRKCPIIPVIFSDIDIISEIPLFLRGLTWVDFRKSEPDPLEQLIWGITGKKT